MNETLMNQFVALAEQEKQAKPKPNAFKVRAYLKVVKILKEVNFDVKSGEDLRGIPGVGEKTIVKVDEIIKSGALKRLEGFNIPKANNTSEYAQQKLLEGVTGIGPVKAKKLVAANLTLQTLKDTHSKNPELLVNDLTHHQILGIKYYEDLEHRIPYDEITKTDEYLKNVVDKVNKTCLKNGGYKHMICGSYRRDTPTSGDIDVLFYNTRKDSTTKDSSFFKAVMQTLMNTKFLKDHLTDPTTVTTKYMGFCKLPRRKWSRRIDMRCISRDSLPTAMLYFTGSGDFNKNMRLFALRKGYTINEYGVYKLLANKEKGEQMPIFSEADIFKLLGMDYIEPKDRLSIVKFS
jgi:DNA polymerase beta